MAINYNNTSNKKLLPLADKIGWEEQKELITPWQIISTLITETTVKSMASITRKTRRRSPSERVRSNSRRTRKPSRVSNYYLNNKLSCSEAKKAD